MTKNFVIFDKIYKEIRLKQGRGAIIIEAGSLEVKNALRQVNGPPPAGGPLEFTQILRSKHNETNAHCKPALPAVYYMMLAAPFLTKRPIADPVRVDTVRMLFGMYATPLHAG